MKDSDRAAVSNSPAKEPAVPVARGRNYLYAIVAGGEPRSYPSLGIDGNDVYTITEGRVAAVVSGLAGSKIRPQRANLAAHQAVLKCLMADTTPLTMAFGTIAASPEAAGVPLGTRSVTQTGWTSATFTSNWEGLSSGSANQPTLSTP